jgi:pyruvate,water dikinase
MVAQLLSVALLLAASFCLGALPLTRFIVKAIAQIDLTKVGTGNASVAGAFSVAGKKAGIAAATAEILRGIAPVIGARVFFPEFPALPVAGLVCLVAGRYFIAKGGGVTNATWGILVYSPAVALGSGVVGVLVLVLGKLLEEKAEKDDPRPRLWAARIGCLSGPFWVWWFQFSNLELLAALVLAILLVTINLLQKDDMLLSKRIIFYSLNEKLEPNKSGEKAANLALLKSAGFNVAEGFVLPPESLGLPVTNQLHPLNYIHNFPFIVRSSAIGEDSETNSAAGQYKTVGTVNNKEELSKAIKQVGESYWTPEAINYRRQRQMPDKGMAVLIQAFINSQVAGVTFSRNPLDGGSQIIIEALLGSAANVVGGRENPVNLVIDISNEQATKQSLEKALKETSILPKEVIEELVKQTREIEAYFHGLPQDIEWCWDGEKVWILQSRPITNLRPIWTRTIAAEVIPGAIPPLTWSINRPLTCGVWGEIFKIVLGEQAAGLDFKETATLLGSHAYFNATLLGEIFRMMGLPEQGLEFLLRGQKMGKPPIKKVLPSLPGLWRLVRKEMKLDEEFESDRLQIFLPALNSLETPIPPPPPLKRGELEEEESSPLAPPLVRGVGGDPSELLNRIEQIQTWLKPITYYNILGPIGLAIRRSLFQIPEELLPAETAPEIMSVRELEKLAEKLRKTSGGENIEETFKQNRELQSEFQQWLETYGYLSEVGTDIAVATWREQPDNFRELLLTMAQKPPTKKEEKTSTASSRSWWQNWRLKQCDRRGLVKGQIAEIYGKFLALMRWSFLAIESYGIEEGILEREGDIFYLQFTEIQEWIREGKVEGLKEKIGRRREQLEKDKKRQIPAVVYGNLLPAEKEEVNKDKISEFELKGIPASVGCVEGVVKVCRSVGTSFEEGENPILVVPYTDAGWAPLLLRGKAIIAEVGGQLSHGAIIAREYQIPAVMNVAYATKILEDGQRVRVDGYRGIVEIIDN